MTTRCGSTRAAQRITRRDIVTTWIALAVIAGMALASIVAWNLHPASLGGW